MSLIDRVRESLVDALGRAAKEMGLDAAVVARAGEAAWTVERPKRPEHGDLATNIAMVLQKQAKLPPRSLAQALVTALAADPIVSSAEIAGPGFINLRLRPRAFHAELEVILRAGQGFGRAPAAILERINLEFVSANPTGPINVASGRNAIYGDTVARLLEATGHRVTREYYINDRGNQIRRFAESVRAISEGREVPEDGYQGEYVKELAAHIAQHDKESLSGDVDALGRTCVTWMLRGIPGSKMLPGISRSLASLGIYFDVWFSEESLYRWGAVPMALAQLQRDGYLQRKDGALFFVAKSVEKPEKAGDERMAADEDRVVQKSNGEYAYFASDIAYAKDKLDRGYDRIMIILGADHHGYVTRMRNALEAQGLPSERFEALLYQLVFVYRNGALFQSSKRAGNFVTIEEVADEIDEAAGRKGAGSDAIRFFFLSRHANSNVAFDVDLAKKKSLDNPIFYVQYGYARLCSILRKADSLGIQRPTHLDPEAWAKLHHPDELAIAARLAEFPELVRGAAQTREPHKVVFFVQELARDFQSYFTRMKTDPILPQASQRADEGWEARWDHDKTAARLAWVEAMRITYKAALDLLGVGAPERMDKPVAEASTPAGEDAVEDEEG